MENISVSTLFLPAIVSAAIIGGCAILYKKRAIRQANQMRSCPHCYGIISIDQTVCENCRRKVVFSS